MPQRYFVKELNGIIAGNDAHHISKVMRMVADDEIIVCAEGACVLALITETGNPVTYQVKRNLDVRHERSVTLIQGVPKHPKQEFIVKYATLFGATRIIFVQMQRSIAKPENPANKIIRLESIAKEAAELAHRPGVPIIEWIDRLDHIDLKAFDLVMLADEEEHHQRIQSLLSASQDVSRIAIIIGPEGGISETERKTLSGRQVIPVSLGDNILTTESACLYALAVIHEQNA